MNRVVLPEQIIGQWIYLKNLQQKNDVTLLMRRNFSFYPESGGETVLFISANSFYQVFINGRFVGAGPRGHQSTGTSYIDTHEVGYYMESGNNLIAVKVSCCIDPDHGDFKRMPGLWCQLQHGGKTVLCSDGSWDILETEDLFVRGVKTASSGHASGVFDLRREPPFWNEVLGECDGKWSKPDWLVAAGTPETGMELHPVPPASINADPLEFSAVRRGHVQSYPCFSVVDLADIPHGKTAAGCSYIFCDDETVLPLRIFSDQPFKFFCNQQRVFDGVAARGEMVGLKLVQGWNRLTVFAPVRRSSMGIMMLAEPEFAEMMPLCDMLESADRGWCIGTLEKLRFDDCSSAVQVEHLQDLRMSTASAGSIRDCWDYIRNSVIENDYFGDGKLNEGDVALFKLDELRYGFIKFAIDASEGDIVDLIVGTAEGDGFFPRCANGDDREYVSCICRQGENGISSPAPADCQYILLHVRKCKETVRVLSAQFDEFSRSFNRECSFSCSDGFFNELWRCGRGNLSRSSSFVVPAEGVPGHDRFMLDAFLESVNVAAVFGDFEYITAELRQFAAAQLEDGTIPALSSGTGGGFSLIHLFCFPAWILFNYRFSSNMVELRNLLPVLDGVKRYLESLLDDSGELMDMETVKHIGIVEADLFTSCRIPLVINALLCRFMMSAAEIYALTDRLGEAKACRRMVRHVSSRIEKDFFDPETGLFADEPITADRDVDFSLYGNFFALMAGIKTQECFSEFVNTFFDFKSGEPKTAEAESPYFHYLFLEMLFALEQREWGIMYLKNYWKKRLDLNAGVLKSVDVDNIHSSGFSGGRCMVPNVFLIREIVGVRIAEPAHSLIYFDPAYDVVENAEAAIPTAQGRIHIKWARQPDGGLEVNIYSSHPIKVLSNLTPEMLADSTFRLSENVVLVKPAAQKEK